MIFSLFLLLPISFTEANTNQYGSVYDDTIPLKPISYLFESAGINGRILSFQGIITAQCKSDACWFKLKDNTGEVLVDLKPYDFRVPLGIVGRKVKLNGRVNTKNGKVKVDAFSVIVLE
jgi:uncharacterized protein YdeI (BOF family)